MIELQNPDTEDETLIYGLIRSQHKYTQSPLAKKILAGFQSRT